MLVLQLTTGEDDLIANAGTSTDTMSYAAFDPDDELYKWFKVFQGVTYNDFYAQATVQFTPDGGKILLYMWFKKIRTFIYLNPNNGNQLAANEISICCKRIHGKDMITMTEDGSKIVYLGLRENQKSVYLQGVTFDGS